MITILLDLPNSCNHQGVITVGPDSVGKNLAFEALVFDGGKTTSTDIAVASGFYDYIGDKEKVNVIPEDIRIRSLQEIKRKIEVAVDQMKVLLSYHKYLFRMNESTIDAKNCRKPRRNLP